VPVLVQATPDRRDDMKISDRRDSFSRQDVGVQQPDAVRDQVLDHREAHHIAQLGGVRQGPRLVHEGVPRSRMD